MTKKETIYNALGMIEGAVCVSQKNTREVLMKAIQMIKDAIEEEAACEYEHEHEHEWELSPQEYFDVSCDKMVKKYICKLCGETEFRAV